MTDAEGRRKYIYQFPMVGFACDLIQLGQTVEKTEWYVKLIQRGLATLPVEHQLAWAIPGGFVNYGKETDVQAAQREFQEETGQASTAGNGYFIRLTVASHPSRDSRQHQISSVFMQALTTVVTPTELFQTGDTQEVQGVQWWPVNVVLSGSIPMAFDHQYLIQRASDMNTYLQGLSFEKRATVLQFAQMQI